jgi:hypothetical protein
MADSCLRRMRGGRVVCTKRPAASTVSLPPLQIGPSPRNFVSDAHAYNIVSWLNSTASSAYTPIICGALRRRSFFAVFLPYSAQSFIARAASISIS